MLSSLQHTSIRCVMEGLTRARPSHCSASVFGLGRSSHSYHLLSKQSRTPFRRCAGLFPGSQTVTHLFSPLCPLTQWWHVCVLLNPSHPLCWAHCLQHQTPKKNQKRKKTKNFFTLMIINPKQSSNIMDSYFTSLSCTWF